MAADASTTAHFPSVSSHNASLALGWFSKILCACTLFLIFAGALVKSTGSGLAVPDWPLSYGMLFPPMVGGVFFEHGHRMIAAAVGLLTLIFTVLVWRLDTRPWVRKLALCALGTVILQGLLGGITVLFFLPTPVSVGHGILAQIFLLLTFTLAYAFSAERRKREDHDPIAPDPSRLRWLLIVTALIFVQLIAGAVMRHTESGLAIPDFPTMGGEWIPRFDNAMLTQINHWRFMHNLDDVQMVQVIYHFIHRFGALLTLAGILILNRIVHRSPHTHPVVTGMLNWLNALLAIQITLGILTVLTIKEPYTASVHVVAGAAFLALTYLFLLRTGPLTWKAFWTSLQ